MLTPQNKTRSRTVLSPIREVALYLTLATRILALLDSAADTPDPTTCRPAAMAQGGTRAR